MKLLKRLVMVLALGLGMLQTALADDEFYGVLEKCPASKAGACVEVEIDEGHVESIETDTNPKK